MLLAAVAATALVAGYFMSMAFQRHASTVSIGASAGSAAPIQIGAHRPDFSLTGDSGRAFSAADFDGQATLFNFWATWCKPCVEEMPMLAAVHQAYANRGFGVVGIAVDEPGKAFNFARELGADYTILSGLPEAMLTARRFGNGSGMLPYSVLVDASGTVRWTHLGALDREELEQQIRKLL